MQNILDVTTRKSNRSILRMMSIGIVTAIGMSQPAIAWADHHPITGATVPIAGHMETTRFWFVDHLSLHGKRYQLEFTQGADCTLGSALCNDPPHAMSSNISVQVFEKKGKKWINKAFFPDVFKAGSWGQVSHSDVVHVKTIDMGDAQGVLVYSHYTGQNTVGWSYNLVLFNGKTVWNARRIFAGQSVSSPDFPQLDHHFESLISVIPGSGGMKNLQVTYKGDLPYGYPHTPYVVIYRYDVKTHMYNPLERAVRP